MQIRLDSIRHFAAFVRGFSTLGPLVGLVLVFVVGPAGTTPARAAMMINLGPSGGDVIASYDGTGSLDTTGLVADRTLSVRDPSYILPNEAILLSNTGGNYDFYRFSGPVEWGPGASTDASMTDGIRFVLAGADGLLGLPEGYTSGAPLGSFTLTWAGATPASLGLAPGSYVYAWGSGATADSITVNIIPEPSTAFLLATGLGGLVVWRRWLHRPAV